jgi:hypothetical protein
VAILFASSGAVNVFLWVVTRRRFGFSDAQEEDDDRRGSHMMAMLSSGAAGSLHSPEAAESHVLQPNFPESLMMREAYIPEPYEPREGALGP